MLVLGIETTCDETAVAVVRDGIDILSNVVASQVELHKQYGGVFPEMAARQHVEAIVPTIAAALDEAGIVGKEAIGLIAVAMGPGLIGPLLIGLNAAKALSLAWDIPFVGVNHVEAHLYAAMMSGQVFTFPALGVVVSGGHTFMAKILDIGRYEWIGGTVDDAVGEAFDKVAALLELPYPGGPEIEALAKKGDSSRFLFKAGRVKGRPWDFSFSGLKTNVLYAVKGQNGDRHAALTLTEQEKCDVAASFQEAALGAIVTKAEKAAEEFGCRAIYVGGGVSNNTYFKNMFKIPLPIYWPGKSLSLDNGAMIAGLGFHIYKANGPSSFDLEPKTKLTQMKSLLLN